MLFVRRLVFVIALATVFFTSLSAQAPQPSPMPLAGIDMVWNIVRPRPSASDHCRRQAIALIDPRSLGYARRIGAGRLILMADLSEGKAHVAIAVKR
jgi:hypothetical protein